MTEETSNSDRGNSTAKVQRRTEYSKKNCEKFKMARKQEELQNLFMLSGVYVTFPPTTQA